MITKQIEMKRENVPAVWLGESYVKKEKTPERKQTRFSKGIIILASRRIVKVHNEEAWLVESETRENQFYKVTESMECDCPDFVRRGETCKHAYAVIRRFTA